MREDVLGEGQRASMIYSPIESLPRHTLLRVTIPTGVRHQIRVQLATLGHPIVGDVLYGSTEPGTRLCLHATKLTFTHPLTGKQVQFQSPLPEDFQAVKRRLRVSFSLANHPSRAFSVGVASGFFLPCPSPMREKEFSGVEDGERVTPQLGGFCLWSWSRSCTG